MTKQLKMNKKSSSDSDEDLYFLDWWILLKYPLIGYVIVLSIKFCCGYPIGFLDISLISLATGCILFLTEYFSGKNIYKEDWWQQGFPLARISCGCNSCKEWRRSRHKFLFLSFPLLILSLFTLTICVFMLPHIPFDYGTGQKISKTKLFLKIKDIEFSLEQTVENKSYKIRRVPTDELVENKIGKYYIVDLKYSLASEKLLFEPGRYVISPSNEKFIDCTSKFIDSIYSYLHAGYNSEIFVKGSADILSHNTFAGKLDEKFGRLQGFSAFNILPKMEDGRWTEIFKVFKVGDNFSNNELPNLRGRFIQYTFEKVFKNIKKPILLEGEIELKESSQYRNAYLILYFDPNRLK